MSVEAQIESDHIEIRVIDNGTGFDSEHAQDMFKPFQRLHNAHDFEGHGMGLANVNRIVERHGGESRRHQRRAKAQLSRSPCHFARMCLCQHWTPNAMSASHKMPKTG